MEGEQDSSKYPEYRILRGGQDAGLPWGRLGWGVFMGKLRGVGWFTEP